MAEERDVLAEDLVDVHEAPDVERPGVFAVGHEVFRLQRVRSRLEHRLRGRPVVALDDRGAGHRRAGEVVHDDGAVLHGVGGEPRLHPHGQLGAVGRVLLAHGRKDGLQGGRRGLRRNLLLQRGVADEVPRVHTAGVGAVDRLGLLALAHVPALDADCAGPAGAAWALRASAVHVEKPPSKAVVLRERGEPLRGRDPHLTEDLRLGVRVARVRRPVDRLADEGGVGVLVVLGAPFPADVGVLGLTHLQQGRRVRRGAIFNIGAQRRDGGGAPGCCED
mmetsp:Transcript_9986/g.27431  ORF Transcript_9986/g.27431 Transcript_9986/m.27431 type:complete len:277 (+) Transcript_9986:493-1323(+)